MPPPCSANTAPCEVDRSTYYAYASIMQGLSSHGAPTGRAQKLQEMYPIDGQNWLNDLRMYIKYI